MKKVTDADLNMRKEFYKESKALAEKPEKEDRKVAIRFKCPECGFIATTNMGRCLSCGYRPKDLLK